MLIGFSRIPQLTEGGGFPVLKPAVELGAVKGESDVSGVSPGGDCSRDPRRAGNRGTHPSKTAKGGAPVTNMAPARPSAHRVCLMHSPTETPQSDCSAESHASYPNCHLEKVKGADGRLGQG
jgi:hypothetical protein